MNKQSTGTEAEMMDCPKGVYWTLNYDCRDCPDKKNCEYANLFFEDTDTGEF